MTPPHSRPDGPMDLRRPWIERFVWRRMRFFGRFASALAMMAVVFMATGLVWLLVAYDKVFSVTAATEVLVMEVSRGPALHWPVGGARTGCDDAQFDTLPEGTLLALSHPLKVSVRMERALDKAGEDFVVFQFEPFAANLDPVPLALLDSTTEPGRPLAPTVICLGMEAMGAGLSLPLRGRLELGADIAPSRSHILHDGEATLLEAPAGAFAWLLDRLRGSYQFESDRVTLRLGDKVLLPSQGGCAPNQRDCTETQGFLRLARASEGNPALLRARVVTTSDAVEIVRPSQQITRLRSSIVRRFTNDPWVAGILSLGLFCGGFAWLLIELMNLLRTSAPVCAQEAAHPAAATLAITPAPMAPVPVPAPSASASSALAPVTAQDASAGGNPK